MVNDLMSLIWIIPASILFTCSKLTMETNQWIDLYMIGISVMKELILTEKLTLKIAFQFHPHLEILFKFFYIKFMEELVTTLRPSVKFI